MVFWGHCKEFRWLLLSSCVLTIISFQDRLSSHGPGAKLLQNVGSPGKVPPEGSDLESIRAQWTLIKFPLALVNRVSPELQKDISEFKPTLVPNGQPMTLQLVGQVFHSDSEGWDFITAVMEPDPEKRPTAEQLLRHLWLKQL